MFKTVTNQASLGLVVEDKDVQEDGSKIFEAGGGRSRRTLELPTDAATLTVANVGTWRRS